MIKFTCPGCGQIIEAPDEIINEEQVTCPTCSQEFKPALPSAPKQIDPPAPKSQPRNPPAVATPNPSEGIATMAGVFTFLSILCLMGGVAGVFVGFSSGTGSAGDNDALIGWIVAGAGFGFATWLFLLAQIIHIRALLARKP
jgi:hypothetical protein